LDISFPSESFLQEKGEGYKKWDNLIKYFRLLDDEDKFFEILIKKLNFFCEVLSKPLELLEQEFICLS
jgi:hypothetical protein